MIDSMATTDHNDIVVNNKGWGMALMHDESKCQLIVNLKVIIGYKDIVTDNNVCNSIQMPQEQDIIG